MTGPLPSSPLVSVLVPCYNHARFIASTLDSVLEDGYSRIELLVLDDGSPDGSLAAIHEWGQRNAGRLEAFRAWSQRNSGLCATLNRLIDASRGDVLVLLASDDRLVPGAIANWLEALRQNPTWLAVFGEANVIDGGGRIVHERCFGSHKPTDRFALADPDLRGWEILLRWPLCGSITAYRREAFDEAKGVGKYDESLATEDRDMYVRLVARDALGYTDQLVSQYRIHGTNTMASAPVRDRAVAAAAAADRKNARRFPATKRLALRFTSWQRRVRIRALPEGRLAARWHKAKRYALQNARNGLLAWHDRRIARAKKRPTKRQAG